MERILREHQEARKQKDTGQESDIQNLPYLQAIVKESLRLHPVVLLIQRLSTEDCTLSGYHIPANTTIFINVWEVGQDPTQWENPLQFMPERFENQQLDVRGQRFHLAGKDGNLDSVDMEDDNGITLPRANPLEKLKNAQLEQATEDPRLTATLLFKVKKSLSYGSIRNDGEASSGSVFVTNFPEDSIARDLWKVCSNYGTVVDVFIPFKRSKSGKCFAFVHFLKVINLERLVSNLCTIWIGRYHLHTNNVRFERPQKPNCSIPRGPNHSTPKETNIENSKKSFVSVLKRGSQSHVTPEITKPALVLDETCIKEFDFGMSLMGRAKDVYAIPNLPCIISKEGFQNVKLSYLGRMWVLFEFDSLASKVKFLNHSGIGSWFTELIQTTSSFKNDERIIWISIEGLPIKAWTPNTFHVFIPFERSKSCKERAKEVSAIPNLPCIISKEGFQNVKLSYLGGVWVLFEFDSLASKEKFLNHSDDQDDLFSDGESQEGDVANKADNNEIDVDKVSESSFMHENDTAHKDVNNCKK
nr:RNA-directed DNA polymerase, eukaryota, nucleotide-binding alpha-beta plait domain protein [Tanacetum cinerariifolium]